MIRMLSLFGVIAIGLGAAGVAQVETPAVKAAPRRMPAGRLSSYTLVRLLEFPAVLDELNLTAEQRTQFKNASAEFLRQSEALRRAHQRGAATDNDASGEKMPRLSNDSRRHSSISAKDSKNRG